MFNDVTAFNIREYLSGGDNTDLGEEELRKLLSEFSCDKNLAQLGKNFTVGANKKVTGEQLLQAAVDTIKELQYMAGGMVIFLEAENEEKLLKFYEEKNGFKRFDTKEVKKGTEDAHTLAQLLKVM